MIVLKTAKIDLRKFSHLPEIMCEFVMVLYKYMKPVESSLPRSSGLFSWTLSKKTIEETNQCIKDQSEKQNSASVYMKLTDEDRPRIGRYVCKNGVAPAARNFCTEIHFERLLSENTVCGIKRMYLSELTHKQWAEEDLSVESLPQKNTLQLFTLDGIPYITINVVTMDRTVQFKVSICHCSFICHVGIYCNLWTLNGDNSP